MKTPSSRGLLARVAPSGPAHYNPASMAEQTPLMAQYRSIKERFADSILFFRLGDFYEMFDRDAREASSLLDLTLTQRAGVPMCGIPYHAASSYISRLLAAGKKVAICEQTPQPGKALMSRDVEEVITPGTVLDDGLPREKRQQLPPGPRKGGRCHLTLLRRPLHRRVRGHLLSLRAPRGAPEEGAAPPGSPGGHHPGIPSRGGCGGPRSPGRTGRAPCQPLPRLELRPGGVQDAAREAAGGREPQGIRPD